LTKSIDRARLKRFCREYNARELDSLTPLEIDEHLAEAGPIGDRELAEEQDLVE